MANLDFLLDDEQKRAPAWFRWPHARHVGPGTSAADELAVRSGVVSDDDSRTMRTMPESVGDATRSATSLGDGGRSA